MRGRFLSNEYYTHAGERISKSELEGRLLENRLAHREVVRSRSLWWAGLAMVASEAALETAKGVFMKAK